MKKNIVTLLLLVSTILSASAQKAWSLEDCINYALKNNLSIKANELTGESEQIRLEQAKNQMLPNLSGSLYSGYSQQNSTSARLSTSITLFNGFRIKNNIKVQEYSALASQEDLKKAKESLAVNIASAYLQILYNKEMALLADEQVKLSQIQLERSEILVAYGKIPEGQVYETRAQLSKDQYNAIQSKNTLNLSLLDLAQFLEISDWKSFDIAQPMYQLDATAVVITPADEIFNQAVSTKSNVKASELRLKSSESSLEVSKSALYPSVSLAADYSNGYYSKQINVLDGSRASLGDQLNVNGGSSIGLNVSIPIFSRFDNRNNIRLSKIEVERAKLEVENTRKSLNKEIQQAWFNAVKAQVNVQSSAEALSNMNEAFRFAEEKYNNGKSTVYEYNQAKLNLANAKSNQLQAKYNLLFSIKILDFYKGEAIKL